MGDLRNSKNSSRVTPYRIARVADPVDPGTGLFIYTKTDLVVNDTIPLVLTRTYRQSDSTSRAFGIGTNFNYDYFMVGTNNTPSNNQGYLWQDL